MPGARHCTAWEQEWPILTPPLLHTGATGLLARIKDLWVVQYSPAPSLGVRDPPEQPSTIKALCCPGQKLLSPRRGCTRRLFSAKTRPLQQQSYPCGAIKRHTISQQRAPVSAGARIPETSAHCGTGVGIPACDLAQFLLLVAGGKVQN